MTALSTDKLEALLAALSAGPWELVSLSGYGSPFSVRMAYQSDNPKAPATHYGVQSVRRREDAEAIALVPDLIREVITARARIAELEGAEDGFGGTIGSSAVGHLREMYPAAYEALGSSGRRSLRNYVNARAALTTPEAEGGSDAE